MTPVHRWIGLGLVALFLFVGLTGLVFWIRNKDPGRWFWPVVSVAQAGLGLQAVTGVVLFLAGGRRHVLHYAYGIFPILVLVVAHRFSKKYPGIEWAAFSIAGLVNFGLLLRGYMTGTGV